MKNLLKLMLKYNGTHLQVNEPSGKERHPVFGTSLQRSPPGTQISPGRVRDANLVFYVSVKISVTDAQIFSIFFFQVFPGKVIRFSQ